MIFKIALLFSLFAAYEARKLKFDDIPGRYYVQRTTGKDLKNIEIFCVKPRDGKRINCQEVSNVNDKSIEPTFFSIYVRKDTGAFYQTTSPQGGGPVVEDPKGNTLYAEIYDDILRKYTLKDKNGKTLYVKCMTDARDRDAEDEALLKKYCTEKCLKDVELSD